MSTQIYYHQYVMKSRRGLNSRSHSIEHEGALIRVDVDDVSGYACLHPWVELGDLSLDKLLKQLSEGRISRQVKCALECAEVDREARRANVSLLDSLEIPLSHAIIVGGINEIQEAVSRGFDTVKLKMGRDEKANVSLLSETYKAFPELLIRIDFNGVSGFGALEYLLSQIGEEIREQIDFLEDPFPRGDVRWQSLRDKYGVKVAIDRGVSEVEGEFDVSVLKPAINDILKVCDSAQMNGRNVVITNYMDHPLGQKYAAFCAGQLNDKYLGLINQRCGLVTHGLYEKDSYIERLGEVNSQFSIEKGSTGLGFDDLLENIDWKRLL